MLMYKRVVIYIYLYLYIQYFNKQSLHLQFLSYFAMPSNCETSFARGSKIRGHPSMPREKKPLTIPHRAVKVAVMYMRADCTYNERWPCCSRVLCSCYREQHPRRTHKSATQTRPICCPFTTRSRHCRPLTTIPAVGSWLTRPYHSRFLEGYIAPPKFNFVFTLHTA